MTDAFTARGGDGVVAEFEKIITEIDWTNGFEGSANTHIRVRMKQLVPLISQDMSKILWSRAQPDHPFPKV